MLVLPGLLFPFVIGLFIVIGGVENLGLTGRMATWLVSLHAHPLVGIAALAGGAGLASDLVNNIPAALLVLTVDLLKIAPRVTPLPLLAAALALWLTFRVFP